jgi:transcriptional regulator of acetoin/glycerol metabolism
VQLPPLRERRDLDGLVDRMLAHPPAQARPAPVLDGPARAALHAHRWPGNLRELRNALDYARTVCVGGVIGVTDLPDAVLVPAANADADADADADTAGRPTRLPDGPASPAAGSADADAQAGADALRQALQAARWNVSAVARQLGCSRMTLYRRMKRWGIASPLDL